MKLKTILALAATTIGLSALAAPTATAVWRNNLGQSYTIGGHTYTITPGDGNTVNGDGNLVIGGRTAGGVIALPSGVNKVSVLIKYKNLAGAPTGTPYTAMATVSETAGYEPGLYADTDTYAAGRTLVGNFGTANVYALSPNEPELVEGAGYFMFAYSANDGTAGYAGSAVDSLVGGRHGGLHWSNYKINSVSIGGGHTTTVGVPWNGLEIEEVALFVGSYLSDSDVADYVFPTVNVDTTATMTMTELNTAVAAFGENTFNYFSASPVVTLDVAPSAATTTYLQSALWNGTVFIKDQNIVNLDPTAYGNKNSTLKLSGVSGHWGATTYENTATPAIELEDSETEGREYGYFASNGYSFYAKGAYYYVHTPELKGSGTYKANTTGNGALFIADKFDNFTGKLNLEGKTVWLGTGAPTKTEDTWNNLVNFPGSVRLGGSTIPSNYSTWNVPDGYRGTLRLTSAVSEQYQVNFLTSSAWKGTCQLAWNPGNGAFDIVNYGNANSVIEIANAFGPYPTRNGGANSANVAGEVKLSANWTISNGWTDQTTTFAKLSGSGTLTVNGNGSGNAIPYTITRLEGFTGTIAGARGKFTIGTIVAAAEPTPGTKLVNITTSNAPVLDSTTVVYNNATQDVELEFKAGDGIYVAEPDVNVASIGEGDDTVYYTTMADAITAAKPLGKVITLLANVDEAYVLENGRIKVASGEFTWTGLTAPEGYKIVTTPMSGYTQYTVEEDLPVVARIGTVEGQYEYATVEAALQAAIPMAVGTVVYVLVPVSEWKYSELDATYKGYFNWDSVARTLTRKATTEGEGSATVTAANAEAACAAVTILPTSAEVQAAMGGASYEAYFQKTATSNGDGTWTVTVTLSKTQVFEGDASDTATVTATLAGVLDDTADEVTIPAKRGLYYSFKSGDEVTAMTEGKRKLATTSSVTLDKVDGDTFYQVLVNTTDK